MYPHKILAADPPGPDSWQSFVKRGPLDSPPWGRNPWHTAFSDHPWFRSLDGTARKKMEFSFETLEGRRVPMEAFRNGTGLVIGFGGKPEELPILGELFSLRFVWGIDWAWDAVLEGARSFAQQGFDPNRYGLCHSDGRDLREFLQAETIDVIYGCGLEAIDVEHAQEMKAVLKPSGVVILSLMMNPSKRCDFNDHLAQHGVFMLDRRGPIYWQKFPVNETVITFDKIRARFQA